MAINLRKGQSINLDKVTYDLSRVTIGLGWDVNEEGSGGFLRRLFIGSKNFDLDAAALLLGANDRIENLGHELRESDVIFYGNLEHPSGCVKHTGDNLDGSGGVVRKEVADNKVNDPKVRAAQKDLQKGASLPAVEDDEQIVVRLNDLSPQYGRILFVVSIYDGTSRGQDFAMVENAFIRAVDAGGNEMVRYNLSNRPEYNNKRTVLFGEVFRANSGWKFKAIGQTFEADSFLEVVKKYC